MASYRKSFAFIRQYCMVTGPEIHELARDTLWDQTSTQSIAKFCSTTLRLITIFSLARQSKLTKHSNTKARLILTYNWNYPAHHTLFIPVSNERQIVMVE